ncbi:MAG TPA: hypothetical protein VMX36_12785 [Sedimentisphaerales bacterium]|nr:hypothetical protein [Sedimentisphaerales bacterium]
MNRRQFLSGSAMLVIGCEYGPICCAGSCENDPLKASTSSSARTFEC